MKLYEALYMVDFLDMTKCFWLKFWKELVCYSHQGITGVDIWTA